MDNTIFYLIGHAGVGKLTVAKAIAALTGARIVDNHAVNNPIFNLIELYRPTPLPPEVWDRVSDIRNAILETVATLSPPEWSFVFTHVAFDHPGDIAIYHAIRTTAERRHARFQRLVCNIDELARRIASPERRAMLKDVSPEHARSDGTKSLLDFADANALDLDITHIPPDQAARMIVDTASS